MGDEAKYLETARADRSVWLMKCPPVVSQAWQGASSSSGDANPNPVVAKVVLSLDPLSSAEPSLQARTPLFPLSPVLLIGKLSCEGKVEHKFDMEPHKDNLLNYAKLCRERTQKSMQFLKEILNDLCMYNKRGPNQGTHELKPEYKKSSEDAAGAP
ncbi:hypothetical protein TRIUR3_01104 [Triticum urartu]|uniref:TFIIF beta subunit HTH domain-containing protein n=2 Tax=Triticum TaxID=4564 RepID=A0A9R0QFE5_TRITD|nr:hypothetical protein TRIUR3_01104 [Triticum urartu]VAH09093.1 unnamed protein product [Triticum turgidum subsp. durum]